MGGTLGGVQKDMDEGFSKVGGKVEEGLGMVSHAGQGYEGMAKRAFSDAQDVAQDPEGLLQHHSRNIQKRIRKTGAY